MPRRNRGAQEERHVPKQMSVNISKRLFFTGFLYHKNAKKIGTISQRTHLFFEASLKEHTS